MENMGKETNQFTQGSMDENPICTGIHRLRRPANNKDNAVESNKLVPPHETW